MLRAKIESYLGKFNCSTLIGVQKVKVSANLFICEGLVGLRGTKCTTSHFKTQKR